MRPMLAATVKDLESLSYPLHGSPKLDGVRAIVMHGELLSRSLKLIPNRSVRERFSKLPHGYDGELIAGDPTARDVYRRTVSTVMSEDGEAANVRFSVFDNYAVAGMFVSRLAQVNPADRLPHVSLASPEEVSKYEERMLADGYEGIMLRSPYGLYKFGRSTLNEQGLMKLKRFIDDEAIITGFAEKMHNANEAKTNELGRTARSSHQAGQVPMGTLGALIMRWHGKEFRIGTGFDDAQRKLIWLNRKAWVGKTIKFKYLPIGMKDLPRHPVYLGVRHAEDM